MFPDHFLTGKFKKELKFRISNGKKYEKKKYI